MSFYEVYNQYKNINVQDYFNQLTTEHINQIIHKDNISALEFLALLSPKAKDLLESMARKANQLTKQNFGKAIILYTPLYLGNYCVNQCAYCGFNVDNPIPRKRLTLEEVALEAKAIAKTDLRHILILTGESRKGTSVDYIEECVKVINKYATVSIEIYPLEQEEYERLIQAGVDGLTLYQEVYNEEIYDEIHIRGPKKDYLNRLNAPERACKAKMRTVNIGALLGLDQWEREAFFTGLHGKYLQDKYTDTEISISLPRMRPHEGSFTPKDNVEDKDFVQIMLALRLFLPRVGITISTREEPDFRENVLPLGVTKMSAGTTTAVGGRTQDEETVQFDTSDKRSVEEIKKMLLSKGYQPVFKDWQLI
ncbi:tyrosine lyase ThiH [Natranaerovirga hydrolytica]|uniref:Tyrosine lyase ThiH n=1 Tax=Natranaerovirga hydrolytica TaxID=680378 RepID=A0A4R1MZP2_9FIRM|nr:2-iminoacetate synthase ThiH [Natranaerovirga hydrolytica]TCK98756.1 tyrosine lyase ThiH [Natranaerovirga hydrolytica]